MKTLHEELAPKIVPVILANLITRYPYHDAHLTIEGEVPRDPTVAHPAFGNSFDWHSSAHSHWTGVQLVDHFATRPGEEPHELATLRSTIANNLDAAKLAVESAYLEAHPAYERPYGHAWALLLAATSDNAALREMAGVIARATVAWLAVLPEPIRHGVHANTAFALGLMLDAARVLRLTALEAAISARADAWFAADRGWPERFERSGNDFLSPGLSQADLMLRILPPGSFATWWEGFLPGLRPDSRILSVADVPAVADGQIVHLHGLNLSRAGALARIGKALGDPMLLEQSRRLYHASVDRAVRGSYLETHWLATFAWDAARSIDHA